MSVRFRSKIEKLQRSNMMFFPPRCLLWALLNFWMIFITESCLRWFAAASDLWLFGSQDKLLAASCLYITLIHKLRRSSKLSPHSCNMLQSFSLLSSSLMSYRFMSFVLLLLLLLLHCSVLPRSPSSSSEPLEEHHVAQLLRRFSTDLSLGRHLSLDRALAHHLHQCSYHLRLFRNWLISGQDPLEYFYGQPLAPPSISPPSQPHALFNHCSRFSLDCACSVADSHALPLDVSACLPVSVVMQIASWTGLSCLGFFGPFLPPLQWCQKLFPSFSPNCEPFLKPLWNQIKAMVISIFCKSI